jgi:hypothetical protein
VPSVVPDAAASPPAPLSTISSGAGGEALSGYCYNPSTMTIGISKKNLKSILYKISIITTGKLDFPGEKIYVVVENLVNVYIFQGHALHLSLFKIRLLHQTINTILICSIPKRGFIFLSEPDFFTFIIIKLWGLEESGSL